MALMSVAGCQHLFKDAVLTSAPSSLSTAAYSCGVNVRALRRKFLPRSERAVVGVLDAHEVVMRATDIRMMPFRQEEERASRGRGVFLRRLTAQSLEALPVKRLFSLLLAFPPSGFSLGQKLLMRCNHRETLPGRIEAAANHLPAFSSGSP